MPAIGVTGGIGSGKTTVCKIFESLGAELFYSDMVARSLMESDAEVREAVQNVFGPESYTRDGRLNRSFIAGVVFSDESKLESLNRIVHPAVFRKFDEVRAESEAAGVPLLIKEAALIFEAGGERQLDAVITVDAPEDVRVERVVERDLVSEGQVRARMARQLPASELRSRADYVIDNSGSLEVLQKEVERIFHQITAGS